MAAAVNSASATITVARPDGGVSTRPLPIKSDQQTIYWLPRPILMDLIETAVRSGPLAERIRVHLSSTAAAVHLAGSRPEVEVHPQGESRRLMLRPRLLVGADGLGSAVRRALQEKHPERFGLVTLPSAAGGLRFKVLVLPPNPATPSGEVLPNPGICLVVGTPASRLRMGLLPTRDQAAPQTANLITLPDHPLWEVTEGGAMYEFLGGAFPQLDLRAMVSESDMAAFAASRGGAFPQPQHARDAQLTLPGSSGGGEEGGSAGGVVLVGDALHCFPPDLGQGVNSALEDVRALGRHLDACDGEVGASLAAYGAERGPEAAALTRLVQVGFPLQYGQAPLRRALWNAQFLVSTALSRLAPALFSPPIFLMIQDPNLSYQEILRRASETSQRLLALGVVLLSTALALLARAWATAAA